MTTEQLLAHIQRLDRLYLAADAAHRAWQANPTGVAWRRYRYYWRRYERACAETGSAFGDGGER